MGSKLNTLLKKSAVEAAAPAVEAAPAPAVEATAPAVEAAPAPDFEAFQQGAQQAQDVKREIAVAEQELGLQAGERRKPEATPREDGEGPLAQVLEEIPPEELHKWEQYQAERAAEGEPPEPQYEGRAGGILRELPKVTATRAGEAFADALVRVHNTEYGAAPILDALKEHKISALKAGEMFYANYINANPTQDPRRASSDEERKKREKAAKKATVAFIAASVHKGLWTGPAALPVDEEGNPTLDPRVSPLAPRVVVMGINSEGRPVTRQASPGMYAIHMLDLPQYAVSGVIEGAVDPEREGESVLESASRGIAERKTLLEAAIQQGESLEAGGTITEGQQRALVLVAAPATVLFPTTDMVFGPVIKGTAKGAAGAARLLGLTDEAKALRYLDDIEDALRTGDIARYQGARIKLEKMTKLNDELNRLVAASAEASRPPGTRGMTPAIIHEKGKLSWTREYPLGQLNDDFIRAEMEAREILRPLVQEVDDILVRSGLPPEAHAAYLRTLTQPETLKAITNASLTEIDDVVRRLYLLGLDEDEVLDVVEAIRRMTPDMKASLGSIKAGHWMVDDIIDITADLGAVVRGKPTRAERLVQELRKSPVARRGLGKDVRKIDEQLKRSGLGRIGRFEATTTARGELQHEAQRAMRAGVRDASVLRVEREIGRRTKALDTIQQRVGEIEKQMREMPKVPANRGKFVALRDERRVLLDLRKEHQRALPQLHGERDMATVVGRMGDEMDAVSVGRVLEEEDRALGYAARVTGHSEDEIMAAIKAGTPLPNPTKGEPLFPVLGKNNRVGFQSIDTLDEVTLRQVQHAMDSRPMTGTRGISIKHRRGDFQPQTASEVLSTRELQPRNITEFFKNTIPGIAGRILFGGDDLALFKDLPRHMVEEIKASGRIAAAPIADVGELVVRKDWKNLLLYMNGESVALRGGRRLLTSGKPVLPEAISMLRRDLDFMDEFVRAADDVPPDLWPKMMTEDLVEALKDALKRHPGLSLKDIAKIDNDLVVVLAKQPDSFMYEMAYAVMEGHGRTDAKTLRRLLHALLDEGEDVTDGVRYQRLLDAVDNSPVIRTKEFSKQRLSLLLATYAGQRRGYDHLSRTGVALTQQERNVLTRMLDGDPLKPFEQDLGRKLLERFGVSDARANVFVRLSGSPTMYVPEVASLKMGQALRQGMPRLDDVQGGVESAFNAVVNLYKRGLTSGLGLARPRYYRQNIWGDAEQAAAALGFGMGARTWARQRGQALLTYPGVANVLHELDVQGWALDAVQRLGDRIAKWGSVTGKSVRVSDILKGGDKVMELGGRFYTAEDLLRIAISRGVTDSFDTTVISRRLLNDWVDRTPGVGHVVRASRRMFITPIDEFAQGVSLRARMGLYASLIESGRSPEDAAKLVTDVLFDYSTTITAADRNWMIKVVMPFWGWQKNANRFLFNTMLNPRMAYRLNVMRKLPTAAGDATTYLLYRRNYDEAGINEELLTPPQRERYYALMAAASRKFGGYIPRDVLMALGAIVGGEPTVWDQGVSRQAHPGVTPDLKGEEIPLWSVSGAYFPRPHAAQRRRYLQFRPTVAVIPDQTQAMREFQENSFRADAYTAFYGAEPIQFALWRHAAHAALLMMKAPYDLAVGEPYYIPIYLEEFDGRRFPLVRELGAWAQGKESYGYPVAEPLYNMFTSIPGLENSFEVRKDKTGVSRYYIRSGAASLAFQVFGLGRLNEAYRTPLESEGLPGQGIVNRYAEMMDYDTWRKAVDAPDDDVARGRYEAYVAAWQSGQAETTIEDLAPALRVISGILHRDASPQYTADVEGRHH